jgi:hypothetical protein
MSTSSKTPASIRHGGPGSSHENAQKPHDIEKPAADSDNRGRSGVSGGGGEPDNHHTHHEGKKGKGR